MNDLLDGWGIVNGMLIFAWLVFACHRWGWQRGSNAVMHFTRGRAFGLMGIMVWGWIITDIIMRITGNRT